MDSLTELYCLIDDCCRVFEPVWQRHLLAMGAKWRQRPSLLSLAELMTLAILFHQLRFRQFKPLYLGYVCRHLRAEFPKLPSYQRCVELLPRCAAPLAALFDSLKGHCDGIAIADATALAVCDKSAFRATRSSKDVPSGVRPRWAGFTALSCMSSLTRKANCSGSS